LSALTSRDELLRQVVIVLIIYMYCLKVKKKKTKYFIINIFDKIDIFMLDVFECFSSFIY